MHRHSQRGVTLIELVIAMVVAALLASVAIPAYRDQMTSSRRAEGQATLLRAATKLEQFYAEHGIYTNDMTKLGFAADPASSENGFYQVDAAVPADGQTFTLSATRTGAQTGDTVCGDLTYNYLSIKSAVNGSSSDPAVDCWN